MRTLELFEQTYKQAFEALGDYQQAYDDNGDLPDGSALLPKRSLPDELMQRMVDAGLGRILGVSYWSDTEVRGYLQESEHFIGDLPFSDEGLLDGFASEKICAHYGTVGTDTSIWIVGDALPYRANDPQERMKLWQMGMQFGVDISGAEPNHD